MSAPVGVVFDHLTVEVDDAQEIRVIAWANEMIGTVAVEARKREVSAAYIGFEPLRVAGIRQLFVHPSWRERGVGAALLERACELASAVGCRSVNLLVAKKNVELLPFYERAGFLAAFEYPDGSVAMVKSLDPLVGHPLIRRALDEFRSEIVEEKCDHDARFTATKHMQPGICRKCGSAPAWNLPLQRWSEVGSDGRVAEAAAVS